MDDKTLLQEARHWVERMKKLNKPNEDDSNGFIIGVNFNKRLVSRDLEFLDKILNDDWEGFENVR